MDYLEAYSVLATNLVSINRNTVLSQSENRFWAGLKLFLKGGSKAATGIPGLGTVVSILECCLETCHGHRITKVSGGRMKAISEFLVSTRGLADKIYLVAWQSAFKIVQSIEKNKQIMGIVASTSTSKERKYLLKQIKKKKKETSKRDCYLSHFRRCYFATRIFA